MVLKNATILVVDDDADVLTALRLLLKPLVLKIETERNPNNITSLIQKNNYDVVILDMNFNGIVNTGNEGIFWLNKIKQINPDIAVILMTAYAEIDLAIKGLKEGAADFLVKPWKNEKILNTITNILKSEKKNIKKEESFSSYSTSIIGESNLMQDVFLKFLLVKKFH